MLSDVTDRFLRSFLLIAREKPVLTTRLETAVELRTLMANCLSVRDDELENHHLGAVLVLPWKNRWGKSHE